jgi:hypothetical protein
MLHHNGGTATQHGQSFACLPQEPYKSCCVALPLIPITQVTVKKLAELFHFWLELKLKSLSQSWVKRGAFYIACVKATEVRQETTAVVRGYDRVEYIL